MQLQHCRFGAEQQPLLLVDAFWPAPAQLLEYALAQQDVIPATGLYPGLRSKAPAALGDYLLAQLGPACMQVFGLAPAQLRQIHSYFSLVCTPASQLSLLQSLPHVDQPNPAALAAVLYLCGPAHGGTSFYRHRSSGYEMLTPARLEPYQQQLSAELARQQQASGPPRGYINGDTALFQRILQIPARYNRLILYRCSSLHSGDITRQEPFDLNPHTGRFTVTMFLGAPG